MTIQSITEENVMIGRYRHFKGKEYEVIQYRKTQRNP